MRKASPGVICVLLGVVLLLAALGLYGYNRWEDAQAGAEAHVSYTHLTLPTTIRV